MGLIGKLILFKIISTTLKPESGVEIPIWHTRFQNGRFFVEVKSNPVNEIPVTYNVYPFCHFTHFLL